MVAEATVGSLVEACEIVAASATCAELDLAFRTGTQDPSVVVVAPDGAVGLLDRAAFLATMAGRYGYGRSLWAKRAVGSMAAWDMPTLGPHATLTAAAAVLVEGAHGYRDVPVVDTKGKPLGVLRPVALMKALAEHTAHLAATDELTKVTSRARFIDELAQRLAVVDASKCAVIVAFIDLDRLKPVNDIYGHSLGDALLRSAAKRLRAGAGEDCLLGRLGGDEFAVVTRVASLDPHEVDRLALDLGERLRTALAEPDPELPPEISARASIGVATALTSDTDTSALLSLADEAMYVAKSTGGNAVRSANHVPAHSDLTLGHDLSLVYQPVLSASTGRVVAVEALLRGENAQGEREFPAWLLQQCARLGTTVDLDVRVLEMVCNEIADWQNEPHGLELPRVHVNIAPESLASRDLAQRIIETVHKAGVSPSMLCLELSEYCGYDDLVQASDQLHALTQSGFHLALDDMGVTLAALRLIGEALPVSCIKVDRSIVAGSGKGAVFDVALLDMIGKLGASHGIDVVAEGVETEREGLVVEQAGIDAIQGYIYSKPLTNSQLKSFLLSSTTHARLATAENSSCESPCGALTPGPEPRCV